VPLTARPVATCASMRSHKSKMWAADMSLDTAEAAKASPASRNQASDGRTSGQGRYTLAELPSDLVVERRTKPGC
jgi:hypothetical protein